MHWIKLNRSKLYVALFKYDFNENAEFNIRKFITNFEEYKAFVTSWRWWKKAIKEKKRNESI